MPIAGSRRISISRLSVKKSDLPQNLVFRGLLEGDSTQHPSAPSEAA